MWKDVLLVIGVIVAVLAWCGVTPKQIARLIRGHIALNKFMVSFVVIITVSGIYTIVFSLLYLRPIGWGMAAMLLYFCFVMWQPIIDYYFSSRGVLRRVISLIVRFGGIPTLAVVFVTWDTPVWRKVVPVLVGFALGIVAHRIEKYIRRGRAVEGESSHKT